MRTLLYEPRNSFISDRTFEPKSKRRAVPSTPLASTSPLMSIILFLPYVTAIPVADSPFSIIDADFGTMILFLEPSMRIPILPKP